MLYTVLLKSLSTQRLHRMAPANTGYFHNVNAHLGEAEDGPALFDPWFDAVKWEHSKSTSLETYAVTMGFVLNASTSERKVAPAAM